MLAGLVRGWQTKCEAGWSGSGLERVGRVGVQVGHSHGRRGLSRHSPPGARVNLAGGRLGSSELSTADGWPEGARSKVEGSEEEEESGRRKEKVERKEKEKKKKKKNREKSRAWFGFSRNPIFRPSLFFSK